jgi:hypothetical protein
MSSIATPRTTATATRGPTPGASGEAGAPWEQQPGEPALWHARFHLFLTMGAERTLEDAWRRSLPQEAGRRGGKRPGSHWYAACARWRWIERARAFDAHERQKDLRDRARMIEAVNERHALQARVFQNVIIRRWQEIDPSQLTPMDCLKIFIESMRAEHLALSMPIGIERHEHAGTGEPIGHRVQIESSFEPSAETLASVLQILHDRGVLDPADDGTAGSGGVGVAATVTEGR